jgi:hypothetical protein
VEHLLERNANKWKAGYYTVRPGKVLDLYTENGVIRLRAGDCVRYLGCTRRGDEIIYQTVGTQTYRMKGTFVRLFNFNGVPCFSPYRFLGDYLVRN